MKINYPHAPQIREAEVFLLTAFLRPSETAIIAVFPIS
ncbi:hypothetical protein AC17_5316 [Escherichia coli 2-210-07_S3_C2]|nr:hypothetical protein AC17_5316 [Escherichia coli 2-210-07_S3_C2]